MKYFSIVFLFSILLPLASCTGSASKEQKPESGTSDLSKFNPEIATGFQVREQGNATLVEIFNSWGATRAAQKFYLVRDEYNQQTFEDGKIIHIPIKSMVCLSATHLSFLDALDEIDVLSGVSSADFVVSPEFQTRLETGKIKEIGIGDHFKLEELINLSPDVLMVSPQKGQSFNPLVNAGLTIVPNGDFLETHPLGRVEWIKFVGLLTGKENEACQIFDSIKNEYNTLLKLTENVNKRPTILSGKQYGGFWNLPGGQSYVSQFFKDAGANYLWADNPSSGGITLDFETVYDQGMEADFWRILVYTDTEYSYQMLRNEDERYSNFRAFKDKKIIYCNTLETPYFQKGLLEPQVILADYIYIFYPELLPNHKNKYYKLLK